MKLAALVIAPAPDFLRTVLLCVFPPHNYKATYRFMLLIHFKLLRKPVLSLVMWSGLTGCPVPFGSAKSDRLDFPLSWGLWPDLTQAGVAALETLNKWRKNTLENIFKWNFFFLGGTPQNVTQTCIVSLPQLLKAILYSQQLVSDAWAGCRDKDWGERRTPPFLSVSLLGWYVRQALSL